MIGPMFGRADSIEPMGLFVDDRGGYTTVAMAIALLLSVTLALFAGRVQWSLSRAAEVQEVADACAMAGSNVVARYATCAQVCDAMILTMGVAGLLTCACALVLSCIPGAGEAAGEMIDLGSSMLDARSSFARSAVSGLSELEAAVPALVMLNSIAVVEANEDSGIGYAGVAVPFPLEGRSDFSSLDTEVDSEGLEDAAENLQKEAEHVEEAAKREDEALMRGWMADCGDRPRCMRERAATLAGLAPSANPDYAVYTAWTFGAALMRARAYYPVRRACDVPEDGSLESLVDSCARKAFYDYAVRQLAGGYYRELPDGGVDLYLPELPHNTAETKETALYTEPRWPCTQEPEGRVLHATLACPGASGAAAGFAALCDIDSGNVGSCTQCQMDATDMGRVAAASTSIDNGFEHYWRDVVLASRDYEAARDERAAAERELGEIAGEGADAFEKALDSLGVPRAKIVPPGAWGCVAIVGRTDGEFVPERLGASFLDPASLPAGMAISAAMLAPDDSADGDSVLAHLFDGMVEQNPALFGVLGDAGALWGSLVASYGAAYDGLAAEASGFLDRIDGLTGSAAGSWIKETVRSLVREAGIEPADIRMLKPVLVSTSGVFERAGLGGIARVQGILASLGPSPDTASLLRALGAAYIEGLPDSKITIAELTIPGTGMTIPLEVDLAELAGGP